ncbi:hypothetical protein [Mesorhizobium sp.]|uniref:hypothetical protein n=1 Tax=Mesorhizobium sp. TaxID=1871066 RepID=UPI000FE2A85C|nr:hypothetical protein [Mesorhizobium sp.]RWA70941.1 MAG: hypothetical protein EOQ28_19220 [Mesorhizobium sp.]RWB92980.1 MAG: hypothetical protein EOQ57_35295 [Mesorhizobium sp.]RWG83334.1 MAG: hypothetical protein EOQ70_21115 [Mesorhizobium sp.]RWK14322.1 MAG: hypothetical protein EOR41_28175 [Mesorhizobium sp.]
MTGRNMTQTTLGRTALRVPGTFRGRPLERLLALVHEWRTRRDIERTLGNLSNFHLRDVCLTKDDVDAACADSFDRSASHALNSAAQNRMGNW